MSLITRIVTTVTGGAADVAVHIGPSQAGQPAPVQVRVKVHSDPIELNRVYVLYLCRELLEADPDGLALPADRMGFEGSSDVQRTLDRGDVTLAGPQTLEPNSEYVFEGYLPLAPDAPASSVRPMRRVEWFAFAGLDVFGNDPDSGWRRFEVV